MSDGLHLTDEQLTALADLAAAAPPVGVGRGLEIAIQVIAGRSDVSPWIEEHRSKDGDT